MDLINVGDQAANLADFDLLSRGLPKEEKTRDSTTFSVSLANGTTPILAQPPALVMPACPPTGCVLCARQPCSKFAHGSCVNQCCRLCCVIEGGCSAKGHDLCSLSENQLRKVEGTIPRLRSHPASSSTPRGPLPLPLPSPPPPVSTSSKPDEAALMKWLQEGDPPGLNPTEAWKAWALSMEEDTPIRRFDEQVQKQNELAIQEERNLEASRAVHTPSMSSHRVAGGIPVTKVTATHRPTITTHMSTDWMCAYEDRTAEQPKRGRGQFDREVVQKFRVVWWAEKNVPPAVFTIQECPRWPKWAINDSPATLTCLGTTG